jgi:Holliday junction resolvase RusA-like endonuclease
MKTEKNKIEFYDRSGCFDICLEEHKPEQPFTKPVKVMFSMTNYADCEESRPSKKDWPICELAKSISEALKENGYILTKNQITRVEIEKRESRIPGISFFMQEVE